jgi:hypothetical protein
MQALCRRRVNPDFARLSFDDFIFESYVFGIVHLEPPFRCFGIGEGLDVIASSRIRVSCRRIEGIRSCLTQKLIGVRCAWPSVE